MNLTDTSPLLAGLRRLGRRLLPPTCAVCGEAGARRADLCAPCRASLPDNAPCCGRCGLPLDVAAPLCGRCLRRPPPFAATVVPLRYAFPVDRLLPRYKFHGDLAAGRVLAERLLEAVAVAAQPEALVPVPLHPGRLRRRGYNQALELARPLARALGLPLRPDALLRVRATAAQSELDAGKRRRNVRGAFAVGAGPLPAHVALVDDVMTTGATLTECARVLRRAGVARVDLWVAARAPVPGR